MLTEIPDVLSKVVGDVIITGAGEWQKREAWFCPVTGWRVCVYTVVQGHSLPPKVSSSSCPAISKLDHTTSWAMLSLWPRLSPVVFNGASETVKGSWL